MGYYLGGVRWTYRVPVFLIVYWYFTGDFQSPPTPSQLQELAILAWLGLSFDVSNAYEGHSAPIGAGYLFVVFAFAIPVVTAAWQFAFLLMPLILMPLYVPVIAGQGLTWSSVLVFFRPRPEDEQRISLPRP